MVSAGRIGNTLNKKIEVEQWARCGAIAEEY